MPEWMDGWMHKPAALRSFKVSLFVSPIIRIALFLSLLPTSKLLRLLEKGTTAHLRNIRKNLKLAYLRNWDQCISLKKMDTLLLCNATNNREGNQSCAKHLRCNDRWQCQTNEICFVLFFRNTPCSLHFFRTYAEFTTEIYRTVFLFFY